MDQKLKGFTLIELLITIALITISVGVTTDIVLSITQSYTKTQVSNEIEQASNFVFLKMSKELRSATSVSLPSSSVLVITNPQGQSIKYCVTGNVIRRHTNSTDSSCTNAMSPLIETDSVKVQCGASGCFSAQGSGSPHITRVSLVFSQADLPSGNPVTGNQFTGTVTIDETIVSRGSY